MCIIEKKGLEVRNLDEHDQPDGELEGGEEWSDEEMMMAIGD